MNHVETYYFHNQCFNNESLWVSDTNCYLYLLTKLFFHSIPINDYVSLVYSVILILIFEVSQKE